ncbi:uncharacterized protein [Procambarus clarkii]|uniref:uncharacterized protein n=1 Tax=Procambarus clarkii TaxID=6728 RepID=UPI0037428423
MSVNDQETRLRKTEGAYIESDKKICEASNASFHGVFTTEPEQLPLLEAITLDERLSDIEVTAEEVMKQLTTPDATEAVGPDKVSPWILKEAAQALSVPLARIFNKSLMKRELPSCWKKENVVPIFNKEGRKEILNYRLVSLTSIPCKVFEQIAEMVREMTTGLQHEKMQSCGNAASNGGKISTGEYRRVLESTGEYRRVLKSTGEYRRVLESTGEYRRVLKSTGEYRRVLESTGEY